MAVWSSGWWSCSYSIQLCDIWESHYTAHKIYRDMMACSLEYTSTVPTTDLRGTTISATQAFWLLLAPLCTHDPTTALQRALTRAKTILYETLLMPISPNHAEMKISFQWLAKCGYWHSIWQGDSSFCSRVALSNSLIICMWVTKKVKTVWLLKKNKLIKKIYFASLLQILNHFCTWSPWWFGTYHNVQWVFAYLHHINLSPVHWTSH